MNNNNISDGVLVYDRFFGARPKTLLLAIKKILLCCCTAVSGMMYILTEYKLPASYAKCALAAAFSAAALCVLFFFVKRRIAIPALFAAAGGIAWFNREYLWERFSYFVDEAMLLVDGRFLHPWGYILHQKPLLNTSNELYIAGVNMGCALLCVLFSLVCAASFAKRIRPLPVLISFALLCVPRLLSERLEFNAWLVPFVGCMAAAFSVSLCYKSGLAVKGAGADYRNAVAGEERSFRINAAGTDYAKRVKMTVVHYSKYFSVGVYTAAIFAAAAFGASVLFQKGSSIDYSPVVDFFTNLGDDSGITASPFEEGPVSEYFVRPNKNDPDGSLNISRPGTGEQEIIRVTYSGSAPIYLRGDVGIDFEGSAWTSPVNTAQQLWEETELAESYRPCEARVMEALLWATGLGSSGLVSSEAVTIDYLCETSVVFLPPYTAEYSFYENELFDVYGDYVVRVNEDFGLVNTVQCTAVIPAYQDMDNTENALPNLLAIQGAFDQTLCSVNSIYQTVVPEMSETENVIAHYGNFAEQEYIRVPEGLRGELDAFMRENGITDGITALSEREDILGGGKAAYRYAAAKYIADYLRANYAYSLTAKIDPADPIMSFLTQAKSGHCSLYASSMVLMLRELGIPARYCTGFMVDPEKGDAVQTLRAKNLHAWCEVYLGNFGWATFDPTSSSVYPNSPNTPNRPQQTTTRQTTTTPPVVTTTHAASSVSSVTSPAETTSQTPAPKRIDLKKLAPYIAGGAAAAVLLLAVVMLGYWLNTLKQGAQKRIALLRLSAPEQGAEEAYRLLLGVLSIYGFVPNRGELPTAFYSRIDGEFGSSLSERAELLEAVAFGNHSADKAERDFLCEQLSAVYSAAERRRGAVKRIKMRKLLSVKNFSK